MMRKQYKRFAEEYIIDLNAQQSAIRAGYSVKTANAKGSQLLTIVSIKDYIAELMEEKKKRTNITADMVIAELGLLAFGDIANLFDKNGQLHSMNNMPSAVTRTIQEVTTSVKMIGTGEDAEPYEITKYKTASKQQALDSLGKHFGIFEKDNRQTKDEVITQHITVFEQMPKNDKRI